MNSFYLDYTLDKYEERLEFVNDNYDLDEVGSKYLEYITDYLLSARDMKEISEKDGIEFKSNNVLNKPPNEVYDHTVEKSLLGKSIMVGNSFDELKSLSGVEKYQMIMDNRDVKRRAIKPKQKPLTQKEILSNEFLTSYQLSSIRIKELIDKYQADFDKLSNEDKKYIYQLKKINREIKTEMKIVKTCFDKVIDFRNISESSGHNVAELINLRDPEHVYQLLRWYPDLQKQSQRSIDGDLKFLLWDLDESMKKSLTEDDVSILEMYWDKYTLRAIAEIKGFKNPARVYDRMKQMASIMARRYSLEYSMWYHENVLDGNNMKSCNSCGVVKPDNELFFYKKENKYSKKCIDCTLNRNNSIAN